MLMDANGLCTCLIPSPMTTKVVLTSRISISDPNRRYTVTWEPHLFLAMKKTKRVSPNDLGLHAASESPRSCIALEFDLGHKCLRIWLQPKAVLSAYSTIQFQGSFHPLRATHTSSARRLVCSGRGLQTSTISSCCTSSEENPPSGLMTCTITAEGDWQNLQPQDVSFALCCVGIEESLAAWEVWPPWQPSVSWT